MTRKIFPQRSSTILRNMAWLPPTPWMHTSVGPSGLPHSKVLSSMSAPAGHRVPRAGEECQMICTTSSPRRVHTEV